MYAAKIMNKNMLKSTKMNGHMTAYDFMIEELKVLQQLEHPNILWLHEIIEVKNKENLYLVTEYHSNGSIGDIIKKINEKY